MKLTDNKNIFCSISAGYSSVMMAVMLPRLYPDHNIIYGMANTSKEREESLEFMDKCDKYFNLNMTWIEAGIDQKKGKGSSFIITDYTNLKRNGEIFEEGIKKYGIPSMINKWCNRDLKLVPLKKFADSVFGTNNYSIAVGIRADEVDRVRKDYKTNNVFYPLLDKGITTEDRNKFWSKQPIQISIPAFKGNCDLCFEKSNRKLITILKEEEDKGKWWDEMLHKYSKVEIKGKPAYNDLLKKNDGMTFYRKYSTIEDLIVMSKKDFDVATDEYVYKDDTLDSEGDCGSGCQVF